MRAVRSTGTGAEQKCEKLLRSLDLHFNRDSANLPGRPDFLLPQVNLALFVHGCFWHAHDGCENAALPRSNRTYWVTKIQRNRRRDRRVRDALRHMGWRTAVLWECRLRDGDSAARHLLQLIRVDRRRKHLS